MTEPLDATGRYAAALQALWEAAGRPTGGRIKHQAALQVPPLKVRPQSWSDWYNGKNVPSLEAVAVWLIAFLRGQARRVSPAFVAPPPAWWEETRRQALEERRLGSGKGGRPATPHLAGPVAPPLKRCRVGTIPRAADCFREREVADRLAEAINEDSTVVLCQVLAGMGGVGKTQLAAAHARHAWQQGVRVLLWVTASSRPAVIDAYADAAAKLGIGTRDDPERAAEEFLVWADTTDSSWLVILDDIQNLADLRDLWPPDSDVGQVVATTRLREPALSTAGRRLVNVDLFTPDEARAFLNAKLGDLAETDDQVDGLAEELGWLPLALAQAAAYMLDQDLPSAQYRQRLASRLLADAVPQESSLPDNHHRIVSAIWDLSVDQADKARPAGLARPLLQLASVLDPNGIPAAVLTSDPAREYLTTYLPAEMSLVEPEAVDEALRVLHRFNLIDHDRAAQHREVRVHQLIQRATREALTDNDLYNALAHAVANALLEVWPAVERDPDTQQFGQILRANTSALQRTTDAALLHNNEAHRVLFHAIRTLGNTGQVQAAIATYTSLYILTDQHLGPDHPHTLITRSDLAGSQGQSGDATGAASAFDELLTDQLRVLGPDHPNTLTTRGNLARWRGEAGDATGAASAFDELLTDQLRVLGPDHPDTLTTRNNLAYWRGNAGDATGAASAFDELLADFLRVLGPDHPNTLTTRSNLAYWRGNAGDATGAASAFDELLTDQLRVLGPDHPDTLTTRNNLAYWRGNAGDATGAATAFDTLLTDRLRVFGPDHPHTLTTRSNLAYWRGNAGDAAGAATAFDELLADFLRVLGPDHPHTLTTRSNLAYWREQAGLA